MRRALVLSRMLALGMLAPLPACSGCASGAVDADAGVSDAGDTLRDVELRFTDTTALQLTPRENVTVELRATRGGEPAPGITVRLALEGDAHDASLMEVSALSGADGSVRTTLRGSSIPATFRVRATASAAAPAFLAVGVSATGFGNVLAGVEDLSATGPARLRVEAYAAAGCDHPSVAEGRFGRAITLLQGEGSARFLGLPAGSGYAIVARGESAAGAELAFGCVDGVQVTSDAEAVVTVRLGARVQVIAGPYDAEFHVPAADLAGLLAAARDATLTQQVPGGDASFLLDALEAHLTGLGDAQALMALSTLQLARSTGLDDAFAQHLSDQGAGPSVALASALGFVESQVGLTLTGALAIEADGDTSFTPAALFLLGPMGAYSGLPAVDGAAPSLSFVTELDLVGAVVMFEPVVIALPLGAQVEAMLADAVAVSALGSWGALSGASSAAGFSNPAVDGVCNEVCRASVFAAAAGALRDAWFDALGRDVGSVTLTLRGDAAASDPDGDLRANALDAQLEGDATLGGTTLPLVGTLSATRSAAPVLP